MTSGFAEFTEHVNPTMGRFLAMTGRDLRLVRADGTTLIDAEGRHFDDWVAGFGSFNLGHNAAVVRDALRSALDDGSPNLFPENLNPSSGALAAALTRAAGAPFEIAHFCNSGSEAVAYAIETARVATGRTQLAYAEKAFHGTLFPDEERRLSACRTAAFQAAGRMPAVRQAGSLRSVAFGDLDALAQALHDHDVAAFLVEPVQMEGGVRVASTKYLREAAELCRAHGTLLIFDEVQTGMGRSGRLFAFEALGVTPDLFVLAKALGGGMLPIGAVVLRRDTWSSAWGTYLRCESQNTTFGGNTLACRAALATLGAIDRPEFLANVRVRSEELFGALRERIGSSPAVMRISSLGLMGGIALREPSHPWLSWSGVGLPELGGHPVAGPLVARRLRRAGILTQVCANDWSVVRVEPPLTVSRETCERFVEGMAEAVAWLEANE